MHGCWKTHFYGAKHGDGDSQKTAIQKHHRNLPPWKPTEFPRRVHAIQPFHAASPWLIELAFPRNVSLQKAPSSTIGFRASLHKKPASFSGSRVLSFTPTDLQRHPFAPD
ncbi:hypothetical protein TGRH88_060450 [Toxoplasma gondii]|uniref:Uncharacterized protein n=1 Tax=Toxoplasma gondii TaxID=5811 RepID=A0A7J6JUE7_TOXGO|nr:hypothetical protein TGRH88_060450 [Toxoplasma gondii]